MKNSLKIGNLQRLQDNSEIKSIKSNEETNTEIK